MKTKSIVLTSLRILIVAGAVSMPPRSLPAAGISPSEMLEKGIYSEETKGDLDAAITIYQQVLAEVRASQTLAAQAQFRLAQCYLKKNKTTEANAAFEKLIHDFPNEKELVAKAREHVPGNLVLDVVPWVDGERLELALKLPGGLMLGIMETRADMMESGGKKIWQVGRLMGAGGSSVSTVEVEADTFRPLRSHWKHQLIGEATAVYHPDEVEVRLLGKTEVQKVPLDKTVFDNEEGFHLLRRLPLKVGYKAPVPILTTLGGGAVIPMEVVVDKKEMVEVPAGKFECFKMTLSPLAQYFWISADEHRYLVKFEGGGAVGELATIVQRHRGVGYVYHNEAAGVSFTVPADWIVFFRAKDKPSSQNTFIFTDAGADTDTAMLQLHDTESLREGPRKSARAWAENDIKENQSKSLKDAKVRGDSWKDETIAGHPAVRVLLDYTEGGKPRVAQAVYALGPKVSEQFVLSAPPEKFEALQKTFEGIIASYKNK